MINCGMYRGVTLLELLEHAMKIVEKVIEKIFFLILTKDDMQFGFMKGIGAIDAVFIIRRIQEEYLAKQKKLYMCYVDLAKALDIVPRKVVEWAMRKKSIPEALVRAEMSQHRGAKTNVKVGAHLSKVHQLLLAIVINVTSEIKEGMLQEISYADEIVLIAKTITEH